MSDRTVKIARSQVIDIAQDRLWSLLGGPQAWSLRPGLFAFDVDVPPASRVRVVLGKPGMTPLCKAFEIVDEVPGQSIAVSSSGTVPMPGREVVTLSVSPHADGTRASIEVRCSVPPRRSMVDAVVWWERAADTWLRNLRECAEGRIPLPSDGMPEYLRVQCTPSRPLRRPRSVSASVLIDAPPGRVWEVVYAPESQLAAEPGRILSAGVVPGTPVRQAGEMQYFIRRLDDGRLWAEAIAVTEVTDGQSALVSRISPPSQEIVHSVIPEGTGTRLDLAYRWPARQVTGHKKEFARQMAAGLQASAARFQKLAETPVDSRD